jgi:hypothetical protein
MSDFPSQPKPAPRTSPESVRDAAERMKIDLLDSGNHGCMLPAYEVLDNFIINGHVNLLSLARAALGHAQCQQQSVATVTDLRCAIDTAYSIANGSFPPFNVAEEIAAHILRKFDVRPKGSAADTSTDCEGK